MEPTDVLGFWFEEAGPQAWWTRSDDFDATVRERFEGAHRDAAEGQFDHWARSAQGAVALVILLDQFPRNLYRGTARAYETDAKALAVAREAIERGLDRELTETQRHFLYMPFMHSEAIADQDRCVELISAGVPSAPDALHYAKHHRDIVRRFGRFPHRNRIFGRTSTPEEERFLAEGGFGG